MYSLCNLEALQKFAKCIIIIQIGFLNGAKADVKIRPNFQLCL